MMDSNKYGPLGPKWRRNTIAAALALTFSTAAASGGGYVADSYSPMIYQGVQQIQQQLQSVVQAIQNARDAIVDAIYKSTASQTEALTNAVSKGSELDSQTNRQTQVELERARRDAALEQANGCSVTARSKSGGAGSSAAGSGAQYGGGGAPVRMTGNSTVSTAMAKAIDRGNGLEAAPSTNRQIEDTAQGACETYGAGNPLRELWCKAAGWAAGNLTGYFQADVRAETLFDGPQASRDAQGFKHQRTLGTTKKEIDALNSFVYHLEKPQQIEDPQKLDLKTRAGKGYLALKTTFDARISMGSKPTRDYIGARSPDKDTIPMLQQLTADPITGAWVSQYLQKSTPKWSTTGISLEELEHLEVERRYLNPAWQLDFASQFDPAVIAREATLISLARHDVEVKTLQEARKTNMLLGQIYNSHARVEMREIMDGMREQSKDAATAVE